MNSPLLHSTFCILHSAFCILLSAFFLLCPSVRAVELQAQHVPPGTGWMALHHGGSPSFWDSIITEHASWIQGGFTPVGEAAKPAESGHQMAVLCNDSGFVIFIRFDCGDEAAARGGTTDIYFSTDESATEGRHPPRHVTLHPGDPEEEKMVPNFFGAAVPIEARKRQDRTRPYIEEERLPGGYAPTGPLKHVFAINKGANGWYVSMFFKWESVPLELPFFPKTPRGLRWRLKVIRRATDGSRYVWGADERPFAGYGFLKWPAMPPGFRSGSFRQCIIAGLSSPAIGATEETVDYWRVSPNEASYGFLAPKAETFQPREAASDTLFKKSFLDPFVASNEKMLSALSYSSEKGAKAFGWPQDEKDRFLTTQLGRLYTFREDVDEMRRRYVLERLLGREVKPPAPKSDKKTKPTTPDPADIDSVGTEASGLELDEEALF